jgi:hypothetical protein
MVRSPLVLTADPSPRESTTERAEGATEVGPGEVPGEVARRADGEVMPSRRHVMLMGLSAYLLSRICVLVGAAVVATADAVSDANRGRVPVPRNTNAKQGILDTLTSWDGQWYYRIVREGYPRSVPAHITFFQGQARAAFFPLFPVVTRAVDKVVPGGDVSAGLILNFLAGLGFVFVVGYLAEQVYDRATAQRSMVLVALFPGSFVLLFTYSEALLVLLAAGCLVLLHKRMWWAAGIVAALGTAARPNGVALIAACAVASIVAIVQRREWRSLAAPLLAPIGWLGFQVYIGAHTGEQGVWFRVQREAWKEGASFGLTALKGIGNFALHPLSSPTNAFTTATVVAMLLMLLFSWKARIPLTWWAYSAVVLALMLMPETVAPRPRFLFTAFPLLIGVAAAWPRRWRDTWAFLTCMCGAGLVALVAVYGSFGAIP